jgi:hypothetical protein
MKIYMKLSAVFFMIFFVYGMVSGQSEEEEFSRNDAIELVMSKISPPAHHEGPVSIFIHDEKLLPGDEVEPFINSSHQKITIGNPSWLAWIDDYPTAGFAHPTRVVIINQQTGEYDIHHFQWWPYLNGINLFMSDSARNNSNIMIYSDLNIIR